MFNFSNRLMQVIRSLGQRPQATAIIKGIGNYTSIYGTVNFFWTQFGVLCVVDISGLPRTSDTCDESIFGFHIHEGQSCTGTSDDPLADTLSHYNPNDCPHPHHSGDLPPLFGNNGYALSAFLTNRFTIREIIGRTVVLHSSPDDFTTQPSGNSGTKIACGVIRG